jgi:hypothetical protein
MAVLYDESVNTDSSYLKCEPKPGESKGKKTLMKIEQQLSHINQAAFVAYTLFLTYFPTIKIDASTIPRRCRLLDNEC